MKWWEQTRDAAHERAADARANSHRERTLTANFIAEWFSEVRVLKYRDHAKERADCLYQHRSCQRCVRRWREGVLVTSMMVAMLRQAALRHYVTWLRKFLLAWGGGIGAGAGEADGAARLSYVVMRR